MDVKCTAREDPEVNEENVIGNWKKEDPCYIMVESLAKLCPTAT